MKITSNYLAKFIRNRRFDLKMSQADLTKLLGWNGKNAQYISNVELSKCPFPAKHIVKLASALNVPSDEIVNMMVQDYNFSLMKEINGDLNESK